MEAPRCGPSADQHRGAANTDEPGQPQQQRPRRTPAFSNAAHGTPRTQRWRAGLDNLMRNTGPAPSQSARIGA